jgi:hypothetical protein
MNAEEAHTVYGWVDVTYKAGAEHRSVVRPAMAQFNQKRPRICAFS